MTRKRRTKKARIWVTRTMDGLRPSSPMDEEAILLNYPIGAELEIEIFHKRSNPRMRQYWGVVDFVFKNQDRGYATKEKLSDALLVAAGICSPEQRLDGTIVMVPDSIAFDNMDESEFKNAAVRVYEVIEQHFDIPIRILLEQGNLLSKTNRPYHQGANNGNHEATHIAA